MRHYLYLTILLLLSLTSFGQYIQITHLTGTAVYGTTSVGLGATGSYGSGGGDCLITPTPYRVAGAPGAAPGTRTFYFSPKVYSVKSYTERIHNTEYIQMSINGAVYPLTAANMVSYTDCHGLYFCVLGGGNLNGPVTDDHSGGTFIINNCSGIDSMTVYCNGPVGGSTFYAWMDTTRCVAATSNSPICAGDTLKLFATGGDTTATYTWYGPGGYTAVGQYPVLPNPGTAAAGTYTVVQAGGRSKDTGTVVVTINPYPTVTAGSNSPVCFGGTISLTSGPATTGETFSWTGPGTYTSAVQNPGITSASSADTGFYTVIATLNGCSDTAMVHVAVTVIGAPWDSSNAPPMCVGDTLRLYSSDTTAGATFSWSGPGGFSSGLQNPVINGVTAAYSGIFTVTATANGCSRSDTIMVTVGTATSIIPAILPHVRVCSGTTLSLQLDPATIDPGATYTWIGPDGSIYNGTNPVITNIITAQSGLYSVYASVGGCNTTMQHNNFVVDSTPEVPSVSSNSPICSDSVLHLWASDNTAGVTYQWNGPAGFTSNLQDLYTSVTTSMNGNYTVTATLGLCSNSAVTYVLINQTPHLGVAGSNSPVCEGSPLNLTSSFTPYTGIFHWSGPNSFSSLLQNPTIVNATMAAAGIYRVYEVVNGCPSDTLSDTVVISPTPAVPVATSNSPVCEGSTLYLYGADATPGVTFSWSGPGGFTSHSQDTSVTNVTPATGGVYVLTATLGNCTATGSTGVNITNAPLITASNNGPVCSGDTLKLTATTAAANTVAWTGPYSFSAAGPSPVRYPAIMEYAGVYMATATEPGGCTSVAYDTVVIKQTPAAPWIEWRTYCQYDYATPLMPVDATNVLWFSSATPAGGTSTAPTPSTNVPGIYFFYLNQAVNGCTSPVDSIQVVVNPKPDITVSPVDTAICPRDSIVYTTVVNDPLGVVRWYPATYLKTTSGRANVAYPEGSITYQAVVSNIYSCTDTAYAHVTVHPAALLTLRTDDSVLLAGGESYHIQPITNCSYFSWFPPEGLSSTSVSDPTATPDVNSRYIVNGITEDGCRATDSIYFHVSSDPLLGIPNAFAPNGTNKYLQIFEKGSAKLNYFRIFDRWGVMVFETKSTEQGWDGNYKGVPQPFGVYVYEVQAVSTQTGKVMTRQGNITLLR